MKLGIQTKIAIGWGFVVSIGLFSFFLSQKHVNKKRYEAMKMRQRIAQAQNDLID